MDSKPIGQSITDFLKSGDDAEAVAELADKISREENADRLHSHGQTILNGIAETRNADPDRIATVFAAALICESHAGLVQTQAGKVHLQRMQLPAIPYVYDNQWYFDFDKKEWIIPPREPDRASFQTYDRYGAVTDRDAFYRAQAKHQEIMDRLESTCKSATGNSQWGHRYLTNDANKVKTKERIRETLSASQIKYTVEQIGSLARLIRDIGVERKTERDLLFLIAELHLNNLSVLAEAFVRHVRVRSTNELQLKTLIDELDTYTTILQGHTHYFKGVSGAYGLSILTTGVDMLHDLQIFLKGQLHELRRTQMLQRIATTLDGIHDEVRQAVFVLQGIHASVQRTNHLLRSTNDILEDNSCSLRRIEWLEQRQLIGLGALGMVISSMRFESTTQTSGGGFLGRYHSTTRTSGGPRIQFRDAYQFLSEQRLPGLLTRG